MGNSLLAVRDINHKYIVVVRVEVVMTSAFYIKESDYYRKCSSDE